MQKREVSGECYHADRSRGGAQRSRSEAIDPRGSAVGNHPARTGHIRVDVPDRHRRRRNQPHVIDGVEGPGNGGAGRCLVRGEMLIEGRPHGGVRFQPGAEQIVIRGREEAGEGECRIGLEKMGRMPAGRSMLPSDPRAPGAQAARSAIRGGRSARFVRLSPPGRAEAKGGNPRNQQVVVRGDDVEKPEPRSGGGEHRPTEPLGCLEHFFRVEIALAGHHETATSQSEAGAQWSELLVMLPRILVRPSFDLVAVGLDLYPPIVGDRNRRLAKRHV